MHHLLVQCEHTGALEGSRCLCMQISWSDIRTSDEPFDARQWDKMPHSHCLVHAGCLWPHITADLAAPGNKWQTQLLLSEPNLLLTALQGGFRSSLPERQYKAASLTKFQTRRQAWNFRTATNASETHSSSVQSRHVGVHFFLPVWLIIGCVITRWLLRLSWR